MALGPYRFIRVNDFFSDVFTWQALGDVASAAFDPASKRMALTFLTSGSPCCLLLSFVQKDVFRVRFNPAKGEVGEYSGQNTRSVVMDTFEDLRGTLLSMERFQVSLEEQPDLRVLTTVDEAGAVAMKVEIGMRPFRIAVFHYHTGNEIKIWETALPAICFRQEPTGDFAIVQAVIRPSSAIYVGFGEQGGKSLVKNSEQLNFFSFDNYTYNQIYNVGPTDNREPLYHSDPFFMEFNGSAGVHGAYGLFIDTPAQAFVDLGVTDSSRYLIGTRYGDLDYYFFLGRDSADIIDGFTSLVGKARLKPRYALGYHQGCYGYENRGALEWAADKYRQYQIPLDGLHIDVDVQRDYQTFTIDETKFPGPQAMFAGLRVKGVKCATNITPIISNASADYGTYTDGLNRAMFVLDSRCAPADAATQCYQVYGGGNQYETFENRLTGSNYNSGTKPYVGEVNYGGTLGTTGHYPDLGRQDARRWWGTQYQYLFDMGLEMVWQDMTTPAIRETRGDMKGFPFQLMVTDDFLSDVPPRSTPAIKVWNLYSYNLHKATYHGLNNLPGRGDRRNFIVGRGSFTGMHRFAALWTGDNASSWDFLRINIAQVLSLGLCGQAIAGQDIGGFARGEPNQGWVGPELLMRWTMAGAFLPWFRNHYVRKGQKEFQEPFQYQEWFSTYNQPVPDPELYAMVVPVCRFYIQRRYRLLQMFYDLMFANTLNGMPICRPLFVTDPGDAGLYTHKAEFLNDEFCVGKDLLVAPVIEPQNTGGGRRDIYLPAGSNWYCFMDGLMPLDHPVAGGSTVNFDASLGIDGDHIAFLLPTYVREGAIIPTIGLEQYVGELNGRGQPNPITFEIYPGGQGHHVCYLDDGVSRSSAARKPPEQGGDERAADRYRETHVSHHWKNATTRRIDVVRRHDGYTPLEKFFYVSVLLEHGASLTPARVTVSGKELPVVDGAAREQLPDAGGWLHEPRANSVVIKVPDDARAIGIELYYR